MTAHLSLPSRLDLSEAATLATDLLNRRGKALTLAASEVSHLGAPCLQVLLAAQRSWGEDGHALTLSDPSPALIEHLAVFGLTPAALETASQEP